MSSNIVKYGITPDFNQNQLVNAVLQNVTGAISYSSTLAPFTTGQMFFSDAINGPCYIDENGQIYPMDGRWSHLFGDTVLENQLLQIGAGTSLSAVNGGIIDANQFNGSGVINVVYGGTSSSGFTLNNVLLGNGTSAIKATGLYYNPESGSLGIGFADTIATINMTGTVAQKKALWRVAPRSLISSPLPNTFEYDGSGYFFTAEWGTRYTLATTSDSLVNSFTGILPISKGGTNANGFTHGAIIVASGSTLLSLVGNFAGAIPEWNGTRWISSTTGYITQLPTSNDRNTIRPTNPNVIPLTLRTASVTGYALAIQQSGGIQTFAVDASGNAFFGTKLYAYNPGATSIPYISLVAYPSRHSPYLKMESNSSVGGHAGWINTSAGIAINSSGGYINTAGSALGPGGYINTGSNGGSIDTAAGGSGFIQLGIDFTTNRTTIIGGAAGSNKTIRLPNQNGHIPVVTGLASGWLVSHNGDNFVMVSGGGGGAGGGITSLNTLTASDQTLTIQISGNAVAIFSNTDNHLIALPVASGNNTYAGLLSSGHWHLFNDKLSTGHITTDDHTQYLITQPLSSGRNLVISSGIVPGVWIEAEDALVDSMFLITDSTRQKVFEVTTNGPIAHDSLTLHNGTAFGILSSDATTNVSHTFPDVNGTVLMSETLTNTSGFVAHADPNNVGNVIFAEPIDLENTYRRFGVFTNAAATTRTSVGIVNPIPGGSISQVNDVDGLWQRFATAAAEDAVASLATASLISPKQFDIAFRVRGGTNVSGMGVSVGLANPDVTLTDPSLSAAGLYFMYDSIAHNTAFWRAISCPSDADNATITATSVPIVTGMEYLFRIRRNPITQDAEFYCNSDLVHTVDSTGVPSGVLLSAQFYVVSHTGIARNFDFTWLQGLVK